MRLPPHVVDRLAEPQGGAVRAAQLVAVGADHEWISRQVSSRRWQRLHRGVLLTYSGPPTWTSRVWAALLYAGADAAVSHQTAAALHGIRTAPGPTVHVTIPEKRRVTPTPGVVVHRRTLAPASSGRPRRTSAGDTVVELVGTAAGTDDAVGWVCDAVRAGVRPFEVLDALTRRPTARRAGLLRELLDEVGAGIESPLERRYRDDVERRHGLPSARLQRHDVVGAAWIRADAVYEGLGVRTELDGALAHPGGRTDGDTWRDNAVLLARGDLTLRYRWRHVAVTPCATAAQVAAALRLRGWRGSPRRCGPACTL